jgi:hypothetical protein
MSTYNPFGAQTYTLGSSISSTDTSILLSSFLEPVTGTPYTMVLINSDIAYGTISPKTTSSEFISFTGITQNADGTATLTGVTRGLAKKYPFTASASYRLPHAGQSQFIISDAPQVFKKYATLENDESVTGDWDFVAVPSTQSDPVSGDDIARRSWVLSVVNGGAVSQNSVIIVGRAGETLVSGNLVYLKTADGLWWKTDADTASTVDGVILGIAQGAGTAGNAITGGVLLNGIDPINTGLTAGATYYASNTAGAISSSVGTTTKAIGKANSIGALVFNPTFTTLPTQKEKDAMAGGSTFGTPSTSNKYITQDYLTSATGLPVVRKYTVTASLGSSTTQFDITNPAGSTFRYTYDGTGTDPVINATTFPIGMKVQIFSSNFNTGNCSSIEYTADFTVTGSGANYFEVTNAAGVAENNKTLGSNGYLINGQSWTKPAGLKYITIELVGGGAGGGGNTTVGLGSAGGGAGGYSRKLIAAASLSATQYLSVAKGGAGGPGSGQDGFNGEYSAFGAHIKATGGRQGTVSGETGGVGGTGTLGDLNTTGGSGGGSGDPSGNSAAGLGGASYYGGPGAFGSGGTGAKSQGPDTDGGSGIAGTVILTEYYS